MPIISKESFNKLTQEEKDKIRQAMKEIPNEKASVETLLIELFPKEALQPKPLTYEDVSRELFGNKKFMTVECHFTSYQQAKKLLAINKLLNVAKFLNKNEDGTPWKPDEANVDEFWTLGICKYNDEIETICVGNYDFRTEIVYFRTEELGNQAVVILGKDVVRLALSSDW